MASLGFDSSSVFKRHNEERCPKWTAEYISFDDCDVQCLENDKNMMIIKGQAKQNLLDYFMSESVNVKYWAASPADLGISFSGSGMPWANEEMAFKHTPNKGVMPLQNGRWALKIRRPNAYYRHLGKTYVPPTVYFCFINSQGQKQGPIHKIKLGDGIPFRSLNWRMRDWNAGSLFYTNSRMPLVRTQEQILYDSAYPKVNKMPTNFWGLRPPN